MSDFGSLEPAASACDVHGDTRNPKSEILYTRGRALPIMPRTLRFRLLLIFSLAIAPLAALAVYLALDDGTGIPRRLSRRRGRRFSSSARI